MMPVWSFPRRQQYPAPAPRGGPLRRGAGGVHISPSIVASAGVWAVAGALLLVAVGFLVDARRWVRLAARSRIGAGSEDEVRHALAALEPEGWRVRHSLPFGGRGDIDSVAIAPTGIAFAIETKTRSFEDVISPRCGRWRCGFTAAGGGGVAAARSRCCASCAHGRWSGSMMGC